MALAPPRAEETLGVNRGPGWRWVLLTQEHMVQWQPWGEPWLRDSLPEEATLGRGKAHPRSCFTEPKGGPPQAHWARAADTCPEGLWGLCSF